MIDSSGESEYTYDYQGRLKTYKPPIGLDSGYYVEYDYNNAGQKTQVRITNGTTTTYNVTYDYFANGWLKNVKYNGDTIAEYSYDEVGNRTRQLNGNGTYTDYTYSQTDARYMMDSITHYKMAGGTPVPATDSKLTNSIVYARDAVGNPLSITDSVGKWQYGYDANNRLIAAVPPNPVPEQPAGGPYSYDWVGNRLNPPADPNPMVYNAADQLMSWPGMHTYTYYPDGSLQYEKNAAGTSVLKTYTYTLDGLLSTAEFNGKTLTNLWDADKNRVGFSVNSVDHTFVYDTTAGIPAVIKEDNVYYVREPNGGLVTRVSGSNTSYYHFDQLGSTRLLTDADGDVTDEYAYDAYGFLLSHNRRAGSVDQPYQYVGELGYYTHYQEPEFRLLQLGVRFYDAEMAGFTQRDPIPSDKSSEYFYVDGGVFRYTDPSGNNAVKIGIAGIAVALDVLCARRGFEAGDKFRSSDNKLGRPNHFMAHCVAACSVTRCIPRTFLTCGLWYAVSSGRINDRAIVGRSQTIIAGLLMELWQYTPWGKPEGDDKQWGNNYWLVNTKWNVMGAECGLSKTTCFQCCYKKAQDIGQY
ncbi:MAG: RHS repeat domain-containing protein [Armatimonadota bacterium]